MARTCPYDLCDGSGFLVDERSRTTTPCRCREQLIAERKARGLNAAIPKRYRGASFDRPPVTGIALSSVAPVRTFARSIEERLDAGRGLWLFGPVGTGKTTLAMLVAMAAQEAGRSVAIYSLPRLLSEIRMTFDDASEQSHLDLVDRLASVDLLQIDDVGAEKTSPWVLEQLYALVNARYEEERSIVLTTNLLSAEDLGEQIGARTASRLAEMCDVIPVLGADLREPRFGEPERPLWDVA